MDATDLRLEELSYKELQKLAKEYGIAANQKKDILIKKLQEEMSQKQEEEQVEVKDESVDQLQSVVQAMEIKATTVQVEAVASPEKNELVFSAEEPDEEAEEVDEAEEAEEEEQEEEEQEDPETRVGGKLFGLATPTGKKKLFSSPALTKSGQKLCDKYNVHWRYEDYEKEAAADSSSMITPKKDIKASSFHTPTPTPYPVNEGDDEQEEEDEENADCNSSYMEEESPEKRVGSKKLLGLPTPNGKSVFLLTPKDKVCDEYNVHWRYEDYTDARDDAPPSIPAPSTPKAPSAVSSYPTHLTTKSVSTPRSVGKFNFVHAHP